MVITFYFKENVINNYPLNFGFLTVDTSYAAASIYCLWCSKCYNAKNCNNHKKWEDSWWTMECSTPTFKHHIPFYEHPKKKKKEHYHTAEDILSQCLFQSSNHPFPLQTLIKMHINWNGHVQSTNNLIT